MKKLAYASDGENPDMTQGGSTHATGHTEPDDKQVSGDDSDVIARGRGIQGNALRQATVVERLSGEMGERQSASPVRDLVLKNVKEKKSMDLNAHTIRAMHDELQYINKEATVGKVLSTTGKYVDDAIRGASKRIGKQDKFVDLKNKAITNASKKKGISIGKATGEREKRVGAAALGAGGIGAVGTGSAIASGSNKQSMDKEALIGSLLGRVGKAALKGGGNVAKMVGKKKEFGSAVGKGISKARQAGVKNPNKLVGGATLGAGAVGTGAALDD